MTNPPETVDDYMLSVLQQQALATRQSERVLWGATVDLDEPDQFEQIDQEH